MKKIFWFLVFATLISSSGLRAYSWGFHFFNKHNNNTQANASHSVNKNNNFEIIPTMDTDSNAKNVVWVGTFQLVWNDLISELVKSPVEFTSEKSVMANNLNKQTFKAEDIKEDSFYKKFGKASKELKKEIETALKIKFNEKSEILDKFNWNEPDKNYILYAMIKKDFEYIKPFDRLEDGEFTGSNGTVKYFGIDSDSDSYLRHTVNVLFYNNRDDFAISLRSKQGDTVYLYRTNDKKTFDKLYDDMINKSHRYMGLRSFGKKDEFKAPIIDFKKEQNFAELCNKPIKNTDYIISRAIETVQFKMDEVGVKLKSEAGIMVGLTCAPSFRDEPRYFYFDNRYIIFIQEKTKPYFAMKIEDAKSLQGK